jgi:hypothetical protein
VGVDAGVSVGVAVSVTVDVAVGVTVRVAVGVSIAVAVGVFVGVAVGVDVRVAVGVGVEGADCASYAPISQRPPIAALKGRVWPRWSILKEGATPQLFVLMAMALRAGLVRLTMRA